MKLPVCWGTGGQDGAPLSYEHNAVGVRAHPVPSSHGELATREGGGSKGGTAFRRQSTPVDTVYAGSVVLATELAPRSEESKPARPYSHRASSGDVTHGRTSDGPRQPLMETPSERFLMLVKFFSEKEYADKMLSGELRAGRLKRFRETEDHARRDDLEGTILWEGGTITLRSSEGESVTLSPDDLAGPIEVRPNVLADLNVFCMSAFRSDSGAGLSWPLIDQVMRQVEASLPTCRKFGAHAVVITHAKEFLSRVTRAAERKNWQVCSARVTYYDSYPPDVHSGDRWSFAPAFLKPTRFELEREFRIAMNTGIMNDEPVTLDIGGIRDIGFYIETRELERLKPRLRGMCPLCAENPCEIYRTRPGEHCKEKKSELHELHAFSCERCGRFSITTGAWELLEQHGVAGISDLRLTPKWNSLVDRHVVDRSLVEQAIENRRSYLAVRPCCRRQPKGAGRSQLRRAGAPCLGDS